MKKSILDQFAADAISAPVAITGGGGNPAPKGSKRSKGSRKSGSKSKGKDCGCPPPPKCS